MIDDLFSDFTQCRFQCRRLHIAKMKNGPGVYVLSLPAFFDLYGLRIDVKFVQRSYFISKEILEGITFG